MKILQFKEWFNSLISPQWSSIDQLNGDIIVITAITPNYDLLVNKHHNNDPDIKFVAFVDKFQSSLKWQFLPICKEFPSERLNAKIHKILIHEFFPKVKCSVWIDGNIQVKADSLRHLVDGMGEDDIQVFKHSSRNCLYSEAHECIARSLDNKVKIFGQICKYTQEGYPQGNGLAECPVILRKNNKATEKFNNAWWKEIMNGSSRDQISFPYVQYKTGIKVGYIPGTIQNNEYFRKMKPHQGKRIYKDDKKM